MSSFVIAKNALTKDQIFDNLENCKNTTVGLHKYQLYCLSTADVDGSCVLLPSKYLTETPINCFNLASQPFLRQLYEDTGNTCAINCFYPYGEPLPTNPVYTYSYSYSYSYSYDVPAYTTTIVNNPTATVFPGVGTQTVSALSAAGTQTVSALSAAGTGSDASTSAPSASRSVVALPTSASTAMDPNFLLTFMAVFAIMLMFVRKAM